MQLALSPVKQKGLSLWVEGTTFFITGTLDSPNPGDFIRPFIKELHDEIVRNGIKSITLDVTGLIFLNSAGIREIVEWILMMDELPASRKYAIHIIYSTKYVWQESSISTFVFLNADYISKEAI